jgi:hypothetical protein
VLVDVVNSRPWVAAAGHSFHRNFSGERIWSIDGFEFIPVHRECCWEPRRTKAELVEVHGRCGNVLHARNPFGKHIDYDQVLADVIAWTNKAVALLNCHEIWLIGDEHFHVVHMAEEGHDAVRMYTFQRVDA